MNNSKSWTARFTCWTVALLTGCALIVSPSCTTVPVASDDGAATARLAVFADPDSDFTTTGVRDVDGELMQFDTEKDTLIWLADGSEHAGWMISGNELLTGTFRVRFGSEGGKQHAYFTEVNPPTVCDLTVTLGTLRISATTTPVPQD